MISHKFLYSFNFKLTFKVDIEIKLFSRVDKYYFLNFLVILIIEIFTKLAFFT